MNPPPWLRALTDPPAAAAFAPADWTAALYRWRRARVMGRMALTLPPEVVAGAPPAVQRQVESVAREAAFSRRRALRTVALLAGALGRSGHRGLLLKGAAHVASGRAAGAGRIMDDVDMLVEPQHVAGVEAGLQDAGWRRREELVPGEHALRLRLSHQLLEWFHPEIGAALDLHVGVAGPARSGDPLVAALMAAAAPLDGGPLHVPSPADAVVIASLHLARTLDTGAALRDLLDIHLLVEEFRLSGTELRDRGAALRRDADLAHALRIAHTAFGTAPRGLTPRPVSAVTLAAHLPPGPESEPAAVRRRRTWVEWWALRHSWRLRAAVVARRVVVSRES